MRCLKPQPDERPASALAVAAALPGGDPLAAALAAGETPSPDMVAAAGQTEALHPAIGLALVATIVVGLIACAALSDRFLLYARVPMQKSLDSLDDRAREILALLGLSSHAQQHGHGPARQLRVPRAHLEHEQRAEPMGRTQPADGAGHAVLAPIEPRAARARSDRTGRRPSATRR